MSIKTIEIKQQGFERIVEFGLATRPGAPICKFLVLELMEDLRSLLFANLLPEFGNPQG